MENQNKDFIEAEKEEIQDNSSENFFLNKDVVSSCFKPIKVIFETLLLQKKCKQQDLADFLGIDKANVSRIVNGLYIPDLALRLKIAGFFGVDSSLIWRNEDIYYIREKIKEQLRTGEQKWD